MRISERGVSKSILMKFSSREVVQISEENNLDPNEFRKNYEVASKEKSCICIFQATYSLTSHARPPEDCKMREVKPDLNWITVGGQHILPKPGVWKYPPIPVNIIYS